VGEGGVGALAREGGEEWGPLAEERGVTIEVDVPSTAPARAIPGAVEQVIDGYVENALDVSPPGSTTRIAAEVGGGSVTLHVVDQGPGLDPVQRARAFDRFWQAPGTHSGSGPRPEER